MALRPINNQPQESTPTTAGFSKLRVIVPAGTPLITAATSVGQDSNKPNLPTRIAENVLDFTGLKPFGEIFGSSAAKGTLGKTVQRLAVGYNPTEQEKKLLEQTQTPTGKQIAGATINAALLAAPVGRVAGAAGKALSPVIGKTAGKFVGNLATSASAGYATDAGFSAAEGGTLTPTPGIGTVIGAAIPLAGPAARGATKLARESLGVSTGTGGGVIGRAFSAASGTAQERKAFVDAMRGNTSAENVVETARGALDEVVGQRRSAYQEALREVFPTRDASGRFINKNYVSLDEAAQEFKKALSGYGVRYTPDGALDFSKSKLRYSTDVQSTIQKAADDFQKYSGKKVAIDEADNFMQALGDMYNPSKSGSSILAAGRSAIRKSLGKVKGFNEMKANYEKMSGTIEEIQKSLSLGDKASTDTAFRKLSSVLRTNNEVRKAAIAELDAITNGTLSAEIAGQQLSETLPRGLQRTLLLPTGALGVFSGVGIASMLKVALLTSPRLVGELLAGLGLAKSGLSKFLGKFGIASGMFTPGDFLLGKEAGENFEQKLGDYLENKIDESIDYTKDYIANPKLGMSIEDVSKKDPLFQEVRKYKSAEEFVKAIENITPKRRAEMASKLVGQKVQFRTKTGGKMFYDSPDDFYEIVGVDNLTRPTEIQSLKDFSQITKVRAKTPNGEIRDFDLRDFSGFTTKSQLTDIWNKANRVSGGFIKPKVAIGGAVAATTAASIPTINKLYKQSHPGNVAPETTPQQLGDDKFKPVRNGIGWAENYGAIQRGEDLYKVVNPTTKDIGKYQVKPESLAGWSNAWLGKKYSKEEFINNPQAQEEFFNQFLAVADRLNLSPEETAVAWHMGWGELGTGPRETRDSRFFSKLEKLMKTTEASRYLKDFHDGIKR